MKIFVHGDVILMAISSIPEGAKKDDKFEGILQYGEHTGHAHRLSGNETDMFHFFHEGRRYLRLTKEAKLTHEEHKKIDLQPGDYEVRIVREHDHFEDLVRPVVD